MKWLIILIIQVIILLIGGYLLTIYPGDLTVNWLGYKIETSLVVFFAALLIITAALILIMRILIAIIRTPSFFKAMYLKHSYDKGRRSLVKGLSALFAQDSKQTAREAEAVRRFLHENELATFFEAEAALIQGDLNKAQPLYQVLSQSRDYQYLAYQGMTRVYLKDRNDKEALEWALRAKDAYWMSRWARDVIIDQAIKSNNLGLALSELNEMLKLHVGAHHEYNYKKASILIKLAEQSKQNGDLKKAMAFTQEAYDGLEDKREVGFLYADLLRKVKGKKAALKLIEQIWPNSPDSKLSKLYLEMMPADSEINKIATLRRLASFSAHHPKSLLILAQTAIDAQLFGEARDYLNMLIAEGYQTDDVLKLMAVLDRGVYSY